MSKKVTFNEKNMNIDNDKIVIDEQTGRVFGQILSRLRADGEITKEEEQEYKEQFKSFKTPPEKVQQIPDEEESGDTRFSLYKSLFQFVLVNTMFWGMHFLCLSCSSGKNFKNKQVFLNYLSGFERQIIYEKKVSFYV